MHFTKSSYYLYLYSTSPVILQTKKRNPLPLQNLRKQKLVILRFLRPVNTFGFTPLELCKQGFPCYGRLCLLNSENSVNSLKALG